MNLKGGVGKTISCCNIAHILATVYNKRVLVVDNDKQGNSSKFFHLHDYDKFSVADVLMVKNIDMQKVIQNTEYENLDLIQANMMLVKANIEILSDIGRPQQTRLKTALERVAGHYDYCIIDNAPEINMATVNALVASDEVLIPLTIDKFAFDGLDELYNQIESAKEFNENLCLRGCFITQWRNNDINRQQEAWLIEQEKYCAFHTHIRRTEKITQSTFEEQPILLYSRRSAAARDYLKFVKEYLEVGKE